MMKKLLGIILCCTLLLSCMPAMAAITGGSTLPSIDYVANLYTVDVSGSAPALKLNGAAVDGLMTERGTVSIDTDATGVKSVKLTNGADHVPADLSSLIGATTAYCGLGSALRFDFTNDPFKGNLLIKFRTKHDLDYGINGNYNFYSKPLNIGGKHYYGVGIAAGDHDILIEDGNSFAVNTVAGNSLGDAIKKDTWYDFTVLYNTAESKFKFWINGIQYIGADGSEWFADDTAVGEAGITTFDLGTVIKMSRLDCFEGSTYFKDIAFGLYEAPAVEKAVNRIYLNFEEPTAHTYSGNSGANRTIYQQYKLNGTATPVAYGDSYLKLGNESDSYSGTRTITYVAAPSGTQGAPNTGKVLKLENANSSTAGAQLMFSFANSSSQTNSIDENIVVEFDFCNGSTSDTGAIYPFYIGRENSNLYQERDMLMFDKTGIYAQGNLIKEGSTLNNWYHVEILYAPNTDLYKVWINGDPMADSQGEVWFRNMPVDNATATFMGFCVGNGLNMPAGTIGYFDNFEVYQLNDYVSFENAQLDYDLEEKIVSATITARNKTASDIVAVPILAVYDQEDVVLKKLTIGAPETVTAGTVKTLEPSVNISELQTMCMAKAFVWNTTFEGMTPFDADAYFGRDVYEGVFARFNIDPLAVPEA